MSGIGGAELRDRSPTGESGGQRAPAVTVVICTRDRPETLNECLAALSEQTYANYSVLVLDNGPRQPAAAVCSRWGAAYMHDPVAGLSRARNSGARACDGEIVAFTDDDALPEPDWLTALVEEFADPAVMAVAGRIRYLTSTPEGRMRGDEPDAVVWASRPRRTFERAVPNWLSLACFGGIGDGNNMAFRRQVFETWTGFDERLGRGRPIDGGEEHLAFMSLIERGHKIVYTPAAVVRHPYPKPGTQLRALRSSVAYLCLLWTEFPWHRQALARYVLGSVLGIKSVRWRPNRSVGLIPRASTLRAIASGLWLYRYGAGDQSSTAPGRAVQDRVFRERRPSSTSP